MITVEIKNDGCLLKHIWIAEKEDVPLGEEGRVYEYYRPGEKKLITGEIDSAYYAGGVNKLIVSVLDDIREKEHSKE